MVDVTRDLRIDFLKLAPSHVFKTSSRAVEKQLGATLILLFFAYAFIEIIWVWKLIMQ